MGMTLDGAQLRMARAGLRLGLSELAEAAGVSAAVLMQVEDDAAADPATLAAIRAALERAGVLFIEPNGGGAGVRLARGGAPSQADPQHPGLRSVGPESEVRSGPEAPDSDAPEDREEEAPP